MNQCAPPRPPPTAVTAPLSPAVDSEQPYAYGGRRDTKPWAGRVMPADLPNMYAAGQVAAGDRFWLRGRVVEVLEVARRWRTGRPGVTVRVRPANGETRPPRLSRSSPTNRSSWPAGGIHVVGFLTPEERGGIGV